MSNSVQRRIEALEGSQPQAVGGVWRRAGETVDDAKKRLGFAPDVDVLVFSWASSPRIGAAA